MKQRVVVLGAGFGGLELATMLSALASQSAASQPAASQSAASQSAASQPLASQPAEEIEVTLIDKADAFVFGFSKLDLMFGRTTPHAVRLPYSDIAKPGVRVVRETIVAIDPETKRVRTDAGVHEADVLVIALGADYDLDATPGLAEGGNEFYSFAGAERLAPIVSTFSQGHAVIGVCDAPFKCPPAPSECALLLHDELTRRGVRGECQISFVMPLATPVPPSPETSAALEREFAERDIAFVGGRRIAGLDPGRKVVELDDGGEMEYDLFLGVPKHRAPEVVISSGMTEDGYVPVDFATLKTRYPGVYAIGDVATAGVPKAGVFAEGAARVVAQAILAELRDEQPPERHLGRGTCYIEFGAGRIGSVDIDFLSGPQRTGTFNAPSPEQMALKQSFGATRRARWFGR